MALEDTTYNLFSPKQFGDVNLVPITIGAGSAQAALITARSGNGITVATPGSGVYTVTFPCRQYVVALHNQTVNSGTDKVAITGLSISAGVCTLTATKDDSTDCAGSEEIHLAFLTFQGSA